MKQKQSNEFNENDKKLKCYLEGLLENWNISTQRQQKIQKSQIPIYFDIAISGKKSPICQYKQNNLRDSMKKSNIYKKILSRSIHSNSPAENFKQCKQQIELIQKRKKNDRISSFFREAWEQQQRRSFTQKMNKNLSNFIQLKSTQQQRATFQTFVDKNKKNQRNNSHLHYTNQPQQKKQKVKQNIQFQITGVNKQNHEAYRSLNTTVSTSPFKNLKIKRKLKLKTFSDNPQNDSTKSINNFQDINISLKKPKNRRQINMVKTETNLFQSRINNFSDKGQYLGKSFFDNPQLFKVELHVQSSKMHDKQPTNKKNQSLNYTNRHYRLNGKAKNIDGIFINQSIKNRKEQLDGIGAWGSQLNHYEDFHDQNVQFF